MSIEKTKQMIERAFIRSAVLLILTGGGLIASQWLVTAARQYGFELPKQFPELLLIMSALFELTWIEVSLMWVRLTIAPNVDVQVAANAALKDPKGAAVVYFVHVLA